MIENELRDLLTARADSVRDNPSRGREVHARVGRIRRRRVAGAALVLVVVALAGALITRLPGRPQTLPAGVPAGPYFSDDGTSRAVPGYRGSGYFTFAGDAIWSYNNPFPMLPEVISNNLASLQPSKIRYTLSALMEFTPEGLFIGSDIKRSAIKSSRRVFTRWSSSTGCPLISASSIRSMRSSQGGAPSARCWRRSATRSWK